MGGKFWCIRDVCGLFCVFFTWLLILYAEYASKLEKLNDNFPFCDVFSILLGRFVVLRVILYSHPNKVFSVINGLIFQVWRRDCNSLRLWNYPDSKSYQLDFEIMRTGNFADFIEVNLDFDELMKLCHVKSLSQNCFQGPCFPCCQLSSSHYAHRSRYDNNPLFLYFGYIVVFM